MPINEYYVQYMIVISGYNEISVKLTICSYIIVLTNYRVDNISMR